MSSTKQTISLILLVFSFIACEKKPVTSIDPPPTNDEPKDTSKLPFLWSTAHAKGFCTGLQPVSYQNYFVAILSHCAQGPLVQAYDKQTGEVKWRWNNFIYPGSTVLRERLLTPERPEMLIINNYHSVYAINMNSGSTIWRIPAPEEIYGIDHGMKLFGDYLYINNTTTVGGDPTGYVFRLNINSSEPQWEQVLKFDKQDDWHPMISGRLAKWINPQGDSILIIHRDLYKYPSDSKAELSGYNLTSNSFEFIDSSLQSPNYTVSEIIDVYQNQLIFVANSNSIHSYDLNTQQMGWSYQQSSSLQSAGFAVHDGGLYVKGSDRFIALDPNNGSKKFEVVDEVETDEAHLAFYENLIFYLGEKMVVIDVSKQDSLRTDITLASDDFSAIHNGVAINESTGQLFITDSEFAMCVNIDDL